MSNIMEFKRLGLFEKSVDFALSALKAITIEILLFIISSFWITLLTLACVVLSPINLFISLDEIEKKERKKEEFAEKIGKHIMTTC